MTKPIRIQDQNSNIYVDVSQDNQRRLILRFAALHNEGHDTVININCPSDEFLKNLGLAIASLSVT